MTNPDSPDAVERFWQWLHDPCLMTLWLLYLAYSQPKNPASASVMQLASAHVASCSDCSPRVRIVAGTDPDPEKRRVYLRVLHRFMVEWMRRGGGYDVREKPEGWYCYWKVAPDLKVPFTASETFKPRAADRAGYVIFDLPSKELYEDPTPLLQHLDRTGTSEVQDFAPETGDLHWRCIVSEEQFELFVRWDGKTKMIASGWTLHDRYKGAVQKHLRYQRLLRERATGYEAEEASLGDEVLALEKLALEYQPDKSWFMGFLDYTLPRRLNDEWDSASKDPLAHRPLTLDVTDSTTLKDAPFAVTSQDMMHWAELERTLHQNMDRPTQASRLLGHLDNVERRVLELRLTGLTDRRIGAEVGYGREWVNRIRRGIIEKAKTIGDRTKPIRNVRRRKRHPHADSRPPRPS